MSTVREIIQRAETERIAGLNPYQTFNHLLYEARSAAEEVDRFDLHSEDPNSVKTWDQLLQEQRDAYKALIAHVLEHGSAILASINHI